MGEKNRPLRGLKRGKLCELGGNGESCKEKRRTGGPSEGGINLEKPKKKKKILSQVGSASPEESSYSPSSHIPYKVIPKSGDAGKTRRKKRGGGTFSWRKFNSG